MSISCPTNKQVCGLCAGRDMAIYFSVLSQKPAVFSTKFPICPPVPFFTICFRFFIHIFLPTAPFSAITATEFEKKTIVSHSYFLKNSKHFLKSFNKFSEILNLLGFSKVFLDFYVFFLIF